MGPDAARVREVLGYLNFSSGTPDPRFQRALVEIFRSLRAQQAQGAGPAWQQLAPLLVEHVERLSREDAAFADPTECRALVQLVCQRFPAAYRAFHRDLLFHQSDEALFQPLFFVRVFEAALMLRPQADDSDALVDLVIKQVDDFVGHRPVAILRTPQRIEPYAHEWVRPIPVYLRGVGVDHHRYQTLVERALTILQAADPRCREACYLDLDLLDELAIDPRAYDFDHPVNKRANYHFGQWDPHHLDGQGRYRRFVLQQATLDVLLSRVENALPADRDELLFEAAAVLAGTMLMAACTSGRAPETHDSTVSLATLLPRIAGERDRFYEQLLAGLDGERGQRLRAEAAQLRQPLAGARQGLNQGLARLRARQQQHVYLARLFATMGYPEASLRQAHVVPAVSARMMSEIDCRITSAHLALDHERLAEAAAILPEINDLLGRAIECGALVDPWNILGFQGQFSIFNALENSVRDHRVDDLIALVDRVFSLEARALSEAAAAGQDALGERIGRVMRAQATWWDQFATTTVEGVRHLAGGETASAAEQVAAALGAWHQGGSAAGDVAFWRRHVGSFKSPSSYAQVVNTLLEKRDYVASMALLMQWLSQADDLPLASGDASFHTLSLRWMREVIAHEFAPVAQANADASRASVKPPAEACFALVRKFLDFFEANAESWWQVPAWEEDLPRQPRSGNAAAGEKAATNDDLDSTEDEDDEDAAGLYSAAYDDMIYRDTARDGVDGELLESGPAASDDRWQYQRDRLTPRLAVLNTVAQLWKTAAAALLRGQIAPADEAEREECLDTWHAQAQTNRTRLLELLDNVQRVRVPVASLSREATLSSDRARTAKYALLEAVVANCGEVSDAARYILAARRSAAALDARRPEQLGIELLRMVVQGQREAMRPLLAELTAQIREEPLLYLPISRGGEPRRIVDVQSTLHLLRMLLGVLPSLGLLTETCRLLAAAHETERLHGLGEGAVTEFDRLFHTAYRGLVESLVESAAAWRNSLAERDAEEALVNNLQAFTELLLERWLQHSRSLRLSALERVGSETKWRPLVEFIQKFGADLFTTRFFNPGNLRTMLDEGTLTYLAKLAKNQEDDPPSLIAAIERGYPQAEAARHLEIIAAAVLENYAEFRDYDSTTTQSDHGEMLYMFLDFLRLKARYDRVSWNLKPVVMAHQILERRGHAAAAEQWRRTVAQRTAEAADWHLARLEELAQKYGMRLPTVADRLQERFVRPLVLDRVRALVRPAIDERRGGQPPKTFALLEQEIQDYARHPTGSGLDVPAWLATLGLEVEQQLLGAEPASGNDLSLAVPPHPLTIAEVQSQLEALERDAADEAV